MPQPANGPRLGPAVDSAAARPPRGPVEAIGSSEDRPWSSIKRFYGRSAGGVSPRALVGPRSPYHCTTTPGPRFARGPSLGLGLRPRGRGHDSYLVDSASSHMLVSKIKPCMSKYKQSIR